MVKRNLSEYNINRQVLILIKKKIQIHFSHERIFGSIIVLAAITITY